MENPPSYCNVLGTLFLNTFLILWRGRKLVSGPRGTPLHKIGGEWGRGSDSDGMNRQAFMKRHLHTMAVVE